MHLKWLVSLGLLLILGCKDRTSVAPGNSNSPATTISLDGSIDKWMNKTPAWNNGPVPADPTDMAPGDLHIMKAFFDNDNHYLYAFVQCSPTIKERYKVTQSSGSIGDLFFDPENNPDTGCPSVTDDTNPATRGYKIKAALTIGVYTGTSGSGSYAAYDLWRFTGQHLDYNTGFSAEIPNSEQSSMHGGALIADGKDGVKMAIPLELLGLKPGLKARIMIQESSLLGTHSPAGFTTYQCH